MNRQPPRSTLFPSTTLSRSAGGPDVGDLVGPDEHADPLGEHRVGRQAPADPQVVAGLTVGVDDAHEGDVVDLGLRSEEHTSELQSRQYLVCRPLLEKKRTNS